MKLPEKVLIDDVEYTVSTASLIRLKSCGRSSEHDS